jgi:NAD(P)-dependent dehydrogenase (short-subunit alcohol dehydrogenase family)
MSEHLVNRIDRSGRAQHQARGTIRSRVGKVLIDGAETHAARTRSPATGCQRSPEQASGRRAPFEQRLEVPELAHVSPNSRDRRADPCFGLAKLGLPSTGDEDQHFNETFDTNVKGTLFTVQKALPLLREGAAIVLSSSTTGTTGNENFSVYGASKAAVRSFARSWILELRLRRIRVNVLSPGATRTPGLLGLVPPEHGNGFVDSLASAIPLGRVADPREIAEAALFLASDASSFVNGVELFADGGAAQV